MFGLRIGVTFLLTLVVIFLLWRGMLWITILRRVVRGLCLILRRFLVFVVIVGSILVLGITRRVIISVTRLTFIIRILTSLRFCRTRVSQMRLIVIPLNSIIGWFILIVLFPLRVRGMWLVLIFPLLGSFIFWRIRGMIPRLSMVTRLYIIFRLFMIIPPTMVLVRFLVKSPFDPPTRRT